LSRRKVLTIIGTRPEAIKLAPVIMELERRPGTFESLVCTTGQHREMLAQALEPFGLEPHHELRIMLPGQTLAQVTARAMEGLDQVIAAEKPQLVLVQGDTTTALCGALSAYYHRVQVGHIEAGLRTGDKYAPFPEEVNRRLIGQVADYHFAPTARAAEALASEGIPRERIFVTGNTVIDALLWTRQRVREERPQLPAQLQQAIDGRQVVLVTGHRRESFGEGFEEICSAIREVADVADDVVFVYPVHLNPNVREPVNRILGHHPRVLLTEPLPYAALVWVMDRATIVLTDSGGIQEEAPSLGKPVLVMRETTERPEGVEAGNARIVGVKRAHIAEQLSRLLRHPGERALMTQASNPYGDGKAAPRIVDILARLC